MELIEKLGLLVSYASEEGELDELDEDEIKTLNNALKLLVEQSETIERLKEEIVKLRNYA